MTEQSQLDSAKLIKRAMTEHDLAAVAKIEREANNFPWTFKNFGDGLAAGHQCWVYCDDKDNIVGFTIIQRVVDELHLLNICVRTDLQGQGIGQLMLKTVIEYADSVKAAILLLEVRQSNIRAQQLYLNNGFNEMAIRKDYYPAKNGREDAILMAMTFDFNSFISSN